ncbi:MAG: zf-HC2 domain-containing protein [Planctomycetes bacterium]|nr:zf-HC2 domain-containing protein [Planctomycetota bacterium]
MTCSEARQYIFAFLDNELDSALSLEVQQHIEHCALCARECEIEKIVRRQLAAKLKEAQALPEFDESALVRLLRSEPGALGRMSRTTRRYWKLGTAGALAAVLVLAASLFVVNSARKAQGVSLADVLVEDFDHFVTEAKPLQIVSADAKEVSEWLRERTALAVSVPSVDPAMASLMGGRKCKINGKPAAFAVYRIGNEMASLVALHESDEALVHMNRVERNGHTHWVDHCRGHTVLACRRGELIYAVISRLPEESLYALMQRTEG